MKRKTLVIRKSQRDAAKNEKDCYKGNIAVQINLPMDGILAGNNGKFSRFQHDYGCTHLQFLGMTSKNQKRCFAFPRRKKLVSVLQNEAWNSDDWSLRYKFKSSRPPGNWIVRNRVLKLVAFYRNNNKMKPIWLLWDEKDFCKQNSWKEVFFEAERRNQ